MSEAAIVKKIMAYLRAQGAWCMKTHGGAYQQAGVPDIAAVLNGQAIYIEVKRPGEKATKIQNLVMGKLKEVGAVVGVATSVEDVEAILNEHPPD